MSNKVINFNSLASSIIEQKAGGKADFIRVRTKDGVLQVRPTNRTNLTNLPKDEMLVDLRVKKQGSGLHAYRANIPADMITGSWFDVEPAKHGWVTLVSNSRPEPIQGVKMPAGASVSDR